MRFRDFLVNSAIIRNYSDKIKSKCTNPILDNVYMILSTKLGYKLIDEETLDAIKCPNEEWDRFLKRYPYDKVDNPKRFLMYDIETKSSYYFGENGMIYKGIQSKTFDLVKILDNRDLYNKFGEFLAYATFYYEKNKEFKRQYLMIGYNEKHRYYIGNDSKFYYRISDTSAFKECTPKLNEVCKNLLKELDK